MPPRKKKAAPGSAGIDASAVAGGKPPAEIEALADRIEKDGGAVLARYRDPLGGHWLVLAVLPIEKVEATPYQRELSPTHAKRLAAVMEKVGRFLDPVIATTAEEGVAARYWTPNGMHRLNALRALGAKAIVALVLPEHDVAFRILALNTEKAHNLRDKSLEVVRMARAIAADGARAEGRKTEADWAFEFEVPAYLTIGMCYEQNARFAGGAYLPVVTRCVDFADKPLAKTLPEHEERARMLLALDEAVNQVVDRLKEAGLKSAYLKPFVIARINPLRWQKAAKPGQKAPRGEFEKTIGKMLESAKKFDAGKVRPQDLASMGGPPPSEE
jgi:ParB family chromosome partitioning protein